MKSNSVEQTIEEIGEDINVAERFEQGLHKTVEDKIPVDIVMSIGGKGVPGATGPVGCQVEDPWTLLLGSLSDLLPGFPDALNPIFTLTARISVVYARYHNTSP